MSSVAATGSAGPSVKFRFLVSVGGNGLRAGLSFLAGLLLARGLQPQAYGELMFLCSSFVAVRMLLDLGTSNAYFTFIAQRQRPLRFHLYYGVWLLSQVLFTIVGLWMLLPDSMIQRLWLGHSRGTLILAFLAMWLQQHWWMTVSQIGEAGRQTVNIQRLNSGIAIAHFVLVALLFQSGGLGSEIVLGLVIAEYVVASFLGLEILRRVCLAEDPEVRLQSVDAAKMIRDFCAFSLPLAVLGMVGFCHDFFDRWLLQRFGGGHQQGFYQIAFQFASISQIATVSILNIFWKEIAEARERGDLQRVADLYRKVNRGLVFFTSAISGFLIPWTNDIVALLLGSSWGGVSAVLGMMFLYPIHQAMGQIHGTLLLASNKTLSYMKVSLFIMIVGLPVSYLVQASPTASVIPGLGLGAVGLGVKMLVMNVLSVNLLSFCVSRINGWKFEWLYQPISILVCLGVGFLSRFTVGFIPMLGASGKVAFLFPMLLAVMECLLLLTILIRVFPGLIGFRHDELAALIQSARAKLRV